MDTARPWPDPVLERMNELGLPLTLEKYLELAYPEGALDPLSGEELALIPPEITKHEL